MKKKLISTLLPALLSLILIVNVVSAAYSASITLTNTSATSYGMLSSYALTNIEYMADNSIINANGTDSRVLYGATEQPHMLADDRVAFATSLGASSTKTLTFTTGSANLTSFHTIVGYSNNSSVGYISTADSPLIEPADNFTWEILGYLDTTAGTNKYLARKNNSFYVVFSENVTGNLTARAFEDEATSILHSSQNATLNIYSTAVTRAGQRFNAFNPALISELDFYLAKFGNPTGTANITARRVSDDAIIGYIGNLDVSTLGGAYAWNLFTDDVEITDILDIRLLFEYTGGDAANYVQFGYLDGDNVTGSLTYYNAGYTDVAGDDATFRLYYHPREEISALGLTTGEQLVQVSLGDREDIDEWYSSCQTAVEMGAGMIPAIVLEEQTLTAPAASVTFSNIDALVALWNAMSGTTSRHLVINVNAASTGATTADSIYYRYNGDTGNNYSTQSIRGSNAVASAARATSGGYNLLFNISGTATANAFDGGGIVNTERF